MNKKIHFPGLNGIRAIAVLIVLFFHIDQYLYLYGLNTIGFHKTGMAGYGVILFFVLSGYLITHLLLIEKKEFKKIDLPKFYIRRILRIWPIYYIALLIALLIFIINPKLFIFPKDNAFGTFILFSCLMSNISYSFGLKITTITPLWSVGVEEQFYAFWPLIIDKSKKILHALIIVIIVYLLIKLFFKFWGNENIYKLVNLSAFDCMAIGGIGAYLVNINSNYLKFIYSPILQVFSWSILLFSIFYKPIHLFSFIDNELNAIIYAIIIINVSSNKKTIFNLESSLFDFIGKISYGIYIFHMTIIVLLSYLMRHLISYNFTNSSMDYILVFTLTLGFTFGLAYLSYNYFELIFLKRKLKYSKIESINTIETEPLISLKRVTS